jgi:hypothetical protein
VATAAVAAASGRAASSTHSNVLLRSTTSHGDICFVLYIPQVVPTSHLEDTSAELEWASV